MRGIDISNWQNGLSIYDLDVDFCICKATEGIGYTDPCCDGFVSECKGKGVLWGFYHFARENEPEDEARYFYDECRGYIGKGIPVLDYETSNYDNREWCERFIQAFHDLSGVWAMLYISASRCGEYENSWLPDKCGLWVAGYPWDMESYDQAGDMPYNIYPWPFAAIWQFTSGLVLTGYHEEIIDEEGHTKLVPNMRLDGDIAYMDADAWIKYAGSSQPTPQPTPQPTDNIDALARQVIAGKFGNGEERKKQLGSLYNEVQARVNEYYEIAEQVIRGDWGNGWNREQALTGADYDYNTVQDIVNDMLA